MEKVLVAGATGETGRKVINLLNKSQYFSPVAMVRKEEQQQEFENNNIEAVLGDLEKDISHTIKNIDKVIFAAGSKGKKLEAVDKNGAKKMIDASKESNIKKFIMLSSMGAENPEDSEELQDYLQAKHDADEYLKSTHLKYAIVRPGQLNKNIGSGKIKIAKNLNKQGEISRDNVAQTLVRALHDDAVPNNVFEIIDGDTLIGKALGQIE